MRNGGKGPTKKPGGGKHIIRMERNLVRLLPEKERKKQTKQKKRNKKRKRKKNKKRTKEKKKTNQTKKRKKKNQKKKKRTKKQNKKKKKKKTTQSPNVSFASARTQLGMRAERPQGKKEASHHAR